MPDNKNVNIQLVAYNFPEPRKPERTISVHLRSVMHQLLARHFRAVPAG